MSPTLPREKCVLSEGFWVEGNSLQQNRSVRVLPAGEAAGRPLLRAPERQADVCSNRAALSALQRERCSCP